MSTYATASAGKRALVTGASSGIGAAIARELAVLGVDLFLRARHQGALDEVAATCKGVKVEAITADLGKPDAAHTLWEDATERGPINILINNAWFGYFRRFDEVDWARDAELVQLNITSLAALSRCFVEAHKTSSLPAQLVNIASTGAYQSVPNMALDAASKAFARNFSEALHDGFRDTPLSVTCICPGGTETAFHAASGGGDYSWIANGVRGTRCSPRDAERQTHGRARSAQQVIVFCGALPVTPARIAAGDASAWYAALGTTESRREVRRHPSLIESLGWLRSWLESR